VLSDCITDSSTQRGKRDKMEVDSHTFREIDTFNDKQSQIAERKTGDGRGPGDHSSEAG